MKIKRLELGFFKVNCYILSLDRANIIIDPGADFNIIQEYLEYENIKPDFILNTHGHYDHIGGVSDIISYYGIPFYIQAIIDDIATRTQKLLPSLFS